MDKRNSLFIFILLLLFTLSACNKNSSLPPVEKIDEYEEVVEEVKEDVISTVKITAVGDIMVHSWQYNEAYNKETGEYDFIHNFADVKKYFETSDIVIGNLETVFGGEKIGPKDYPCFNTPDSFSLTLKDAGFNLLTTANNHCMDQRKDGLLRTLTVLDNIGIEHIGTYGSTEESKEIFIKEVNGIKIAFLSYTYGTNGINIPDDYLVNIISEEKIKNDIYSAKQLEPDLIVVLPHMGNEYETYVKDVFKNWVDMMFEAGADIVLASHPHVIQPMEIKEIIDENGEMRNCFVIYSLGNFISSQTTPPRNAGLILNVTVEKVNEEKAYIKEISFIPVWTQFRLPSDKDHFVVRSVYEMLNLPVDEQKELLRSKDIERLKDIHFETTSVLLNTDVPLESIKDEYIFYTAFISRRAALNINFLLMNY